MIEKASLTKGSNHQIFCYRYDHDNKMHRGIMEALETRAHNITMGTMKDKIHDSQT